MELSHGSNGATPGQGMITAYISNGVSYPPFRHLTYLIVIDRVVANWNRYIS